MVAKREKERDDKNKKKRTKNPKRSEKKKKVKKTLFGRRAPRPLGLPERASGLPFGPQVAPDSGFTSQL